MPTKKSVKKKPAAPKQSKEVASSNTPRRVEAATYTSFRLQKKLKKPVRGRIPSSFRLFRQSLGLIKRNWKLFLGIITVYAILNVVLVQGFFTVDVVTAKSSLSQALSEGWGRLFGGVSVLSYMFGNAGTAASTSAYRLILLIIASLATIWSLRQVLAGEKTRIRESFYGGMYPLIPFILVFLVICLQLIPLTIAIYLYGVAGANGGMEMTLWVTLFALLAGLTLYMISASLFALYIVCLPGMEPMNALRAATDLVKHRRAFTIRRLLFLPSIMLLGLAIVMTPLIFTAPPVAVAVFFVFLMAAPTVVHSYMYLLYRELLREE
jgi:hypothetical protein